MVNKTIISKTKRNLIKTNTIVFAVFLVIFAIIIFYYYTALTDKRTNNEIIQQSNSVLVKMERNLVGPGQRRMPIPPQQDLPTGYFVLIWKDGQLLNEGYNDFINSFPSPYELENETRTPKIVKTKYEERHLKMLITPIKNYRIQVVKFLDVEYELMNQLLFVLVTGVIVSLIGIFFISLYLTKKTLKPIQESWENQVLFIQDASHELRTPLTIISSKLENMLKRPNSTVNDEVENIASAMGEVRGLKKMVRDLLILTKEDAIVSVNKSTFNVVEVATSVLDSYQEIAELEEKQITITYTCEQISLTTDKEKLKQLLYIFIDNAFKYTRSGDFINIDLKDGKDQIEIKIEDSGIGIREEDIPVIFNRFFRSENVRNTEIEGSGVGLAIAKVILSNIKGTIKVSSKIGEGSTFVLYFPK